MAGIHITDIEAAINWWRERSPSPDGITRLRRGARAGRGVRADGLLPRDRVRRGDDARARRAPPGSPGTRSTPDAPCIAICSTSQGDAVCKGCGRTFDEVQHWPAMTPGREARASGAASRWRPRAWRFNRYAERARRPAASTIRRRDLRRGQRRRCAADGAARRGRTRARPRVVRRQRGASRRWPGRCSSASSRCWPSAPSTPCWWRAPSARRPGGARGRRGGLRHGLHRLDGRGAGDRADRRPALRRRPAAPRPAHQLHQARVAGARAVGAGQRAAACFRSPSSRWRTPTPEVAAKVRGYLLALAFALPASLLFTVYRGFNIAVSRPKAVMALQLGGLALKVPLSAAAGLRRAGARRCRRSASPAAASPPRSSMWAQTLAAVARAAPRPVLRAASACAAAACGRPHRRSAARRCCGWACRWALTIVIEVTGFTFMAIFIARLGATPVAGHQIAVNLVSLLFMMPLALANATSTLVAQRIGAGDAARRAAAGLARPAARRSAMAALMGSAVFLAREAMRRPVHARRGGRRRRAAAADLGRAVPHRRRGADRGRVRAARLAHRRPCRC